MRTDDTIQPVLRVLNLVRVPSKGSLFGHLLMCPLQALAFMLPIQYDVRSRSWNVARHIFDLDPKKLIFHIDVPDEEDPTVNSFGEYFLVLAGQWVGEVMTIVSMQATCLLVRPIREQYFVNIVCTAFARLGIGRSQVYDLPSLNNSFQRVGLVRGAGSIQEWQRARQLVRPIFLF
jgi:hypothetical protein